MNLSITVTALLHSALMLTIAQGAEIRPLPSAALPEGSRSESSSTVIVRCTNTYGDTKPRLEATLTVDVVLTANLEVKDLTNSATARCQLDIQWLEDRAEAVLPRIKFVFKRKNCSGIRGMLERDLIKDPNLIVENSNLRFPEASLQWYRLSQPGRCRFSLFRASEVHLAAQRWRDHGRIAN